MHRDFETKSLRFIENESASVRDHLEKAKETEYVVWFLVIWTTVIITNIIALATGNLSKSVIVIGAVRTAVLGAAALFMIFIHISRHKKSIRLTSSSRTKLIKFLEVVSFIVVIIDDNSRRTQGEMFRILTQTCFAISYLVIEASIIGRMIIFTCIVIREGITWNNWAECAMGETNSTPIIVIFSIGISFGFLLLLYHSLHRKNLITGNDKALSDVITYYEMILKHMPFNFTVIDPHSYSPQGRSGLLTGFSKLQSTLLTKYTIEPSDEILSKTNLKNLKIMHYTPFTVSTNKRRSGIFHSSAIQENLISKEQILSDRDKDTVLLEELNLKMQLQEVVSYLTQYYENMISKQPENPNQIQLPCISALGEQEGKSYDLVIQPLLIGTSDKLKFLIGSQESKVCEELQTLKQQNFRLLSLISTTVHDLRTPLNGSIILTQSVSDDCNLPPKQQENLKSAVNCQKRLVNLINDLLDFSQLNVNKLNFSFFPFELTNLINEVTKLVEVQASLKKIKLVTEIDSSCPTIIKSDMNRLCQILLNLLGNALKFTLKGFIKLRVKRSLMSPKHLVFKVKDSGVGIKKEAQQTIFKMFEKSTQDQASMNPNGAGLGLYISNALAERLGSPIEVKSTEGAGSTFKFLVKDQSDEIEFLGKPKTLIRGPFKLASGENLPYLGNRLNSRDFMSSMNYTQKFPTFENIQFNEQFISLPRLTSNNLNITRNISEYERRNIPIFITKNKFDEMAPLHYSSPKDIFVTEPEQSEQISILVVDDDVFNIEAIDILLSKIATCKIFKSFNGLEAIEKLREEDGNISVILMDCNMPIKDGYTAVKEIREMSEEKFSQIPVIAVTAVADSKEHEKCTTAGFDFIIEKPVKLESLIFVLEECRRSKKTKIG